MENDRRTKTAEDVYAGRSATQGLAQAFACAFAGIAEASHERNFRIELGFAAAAIVLCAALNVPASGWLAVVVCIGLELGAECLNSALEAVVDLASPDLHPLAKKAKDCAAGAVLLLSLMSLAVAGIVYIPALAALLQAA